VLLRIARFLLVVALLAGWQNALVHPLVHVDQQGKLVHLGDKSKSSSDASCDVLAALVACAPQASPAPPVSASSYVPSIHLAGTPRAAPPPPFLSQGPPAAL
jgi:hypothetical protein